MANGTATTAQGKKRGPKPKGRPKIEIISNLSNGAQKFIEMSQPYFARIEITGTAPMLMHCWNIESIEEKANAKKGSAVKKTDDVESYVLRNDKNQIVMPCLNFVASVRTAGKSFADPSSPRKSMHDRIRAIMIPMYEFGLMNGGTKEWDYLDRRRVVVQRAGITRTRPAFFEGWKIMFEVMILEPEYLQPKLLYTIADAAGKFQGIGDYRPTFGRYRISKFETGLID